MQQLKKIAYISYPALSDCDLPLLKELSKDLNVDYYFIVTNKTCQGTIINIKLKEKGGIYSGKEYPELSVMEKWIDLSHVFVVNKPVNHDWDWQSFKISWQWLKILKKNNYEIIHITWPLRYSSFPLYLLHKKMVLTMHDPIPHSSDENFVNLVHRWCSIRFTHSFILLNKTQKQLFMDRYKIKEERVHISRLSIYTHLQHTIPTKPLCDKPYVLFVGSIQPHKGLEYFCQAMDSIIKDSPNIYAVIAGKGDFYFDKSIYEQNPHFKFFNRFIINEELASLLINCVAVVCPYVDATQSGVVMSAFALNKPVIATNVGGLPEMMENNRHGFLIPPKDSKALKKAIEQVLKPDIAMRFSKNIEQDFSFGERSWNDIAKEIEGIYHTAINMRK